MKAQSKSNTITKKQRFDFNAGVDYALGVGAALLYDKEEKQLEFGLVILCFVFSITYTWK